MVARAVFLLGGLGPFDSARADPLQDPHGSYLPQFLRHRPKGELRHRRAQPLCRPVRGAGGGLGNFRIFARRRCFAVGRAQPAASLGHWLRPLPLHRVHGRQRRLRRGLGLLGRSCLLALSWHLRGEPAAGGLHAARGARRGHPRRLHGTFALRPRATAANPGRGDSARWRRAWGRHRPPVLLEPTARGQPD